MSTKHILKCDKDKLLEYTYDKKYELEKKKCEKQLFPMCSVLQSKTQNSL